MTEMFLEHGVDVCGEKVEFVDGEVGGGAELVKVGLNLVGFADAGGDDVGADHFGVELVDLGKVVSGELVGESRVSEKVGEDELPHMVVRDAVVHVFEEPCLDLVVGGNGGRVLLDSVEHRRPHEGGIIAGDVVDVFSDRTRGHCLG